MPRMNGITRRGYTTAPVKYSAEELRDYEVIDLRVDYASASNGLTARSAHEIHGLRKYQRELANTIPMKLGHTPLRQGDAIECAKCGASGTVGPFVHGEVFWQPCGLPVDGGFAPFGLEVTPEHCARRARFERGCAQELRARAGIGDEELATGHDKAASAYAQRAVDLALARSGGAPLAKPITLTIGDLTDAAANLHDNASKYTQAIPHTRSRGRVTFRLTTEAHRAAAIAILYYIESATAFFASVDDGADPSERRAAHATSKAWRAKLGLGESALPVPVEAGGKP